MTVSASVGVPIEKPGIVASGVYAAGRRIADARIEEAGDWARRPGHFVWIGLYEPSLELLRQVQSQLGLHRLAIEDALAAHQRPKLERYGDCLFVVARTARSVDGRIALGETHLFVGRGFVVTVRHGSSASYAAVREKTEACPDLLEHGEDYILYAVLDRIVDDYAPVMETVMGEAEAIEDRVLSVGPLRGRTENVLAEGHDGSTTLPGPPDRAEGRARGLHGGSDPATHQSDYQQARGSRRFQRSPGRRFGASLRPRMQRGPAGATGDAGIGSAFACGSRVGTGTRSASLISARSDATEVASRRTLGGLPRRRTGASLGSEGRPRRRSSEAPRAP